MAPRQRIQVTADEFLGYRPIPGFSRTRRLPDQPGQHPYSVASRGRSARRYYNPGMDVTDPRREIGDATYYQIRRRFQQSPVESDQAMVSQARERAKNYRLMQARNREITRLQAEQSNQPVQEALDIRRELSVYNYTQGVFGQGPSAWRLPWRLYWKRRGTDPRMRLGL